MQQCSKYPATLIVKYNIVSRPSLIFCSLGCVHYNFFSRVLYWMQTEEQKTRGGLGMRLGKIYIPMQVKATCGLGTSFIF